MRRTLILRVAVLSLVFSPSVAHAQCKESVVGT
jgi:hypothetical protein